MMQKNIQDCRKAQDLLRNYLDLMPKALNDPNFQKQAVEISNQIQIVLLLLEDAESAQ